MRTAGVFNLIDAVNLQILIIENLHAKDPKVSL